LGSVADSRTDAYRMSYALSVAFIAFLVVGCIVTFSLPTPGVLETEMPLDEVDERLITADDMVAVRAEFDRMMLRKGLVTDEQLDLIRYGTRLQGVVTAMRTTGRAREDHREVELDVMVKLPEGRQFAAHETALIPVSAMAKVSPGSMIDTYYRSGDESAVAVCVPPR
jgi:hypothetical protein